MTKIVALGHLNRIMKPFTIQKLSPLDKRLLQGFYVNKKHGDEDIKESYGFSRVKVQKLMKQYEEKNFKETRVTNYFDTIQDFHHDIKSTALSMQRSKSVTDSTYLKRANKIHTEPSGSKNKRLKSVLG